MEIQGNFYSKAFELIVENIRRFKGDIEFICHTQELKSALDQIINLDALKQKFLFRLYFRKKTIFRFDDSLDLKKALDRPMCQELISLGLLNTLESIPESIIWKMLNKNSLDSLIKEFHVNCKNGKMNDKIQAIKLHMTHNKSICSFFSNKIAKSKTIHPILQKVYSIIGSCFCISSHVISVLDRIFVFTNISSDLNLQIMAIQTEISSIGSLIMLNIIDLLNGKIKFPKYEWEPISFVNSFYISQINFEKHLKIYSTHIKIMGATSSKEVSNLCIYETDFYEQLVTNVINISHETFHYDLYHACIVRCCSKISEGLAIKKEYVKLISLLNALLQQRSYSNKYRGQWYNRLLITYFKYLKNREESLRVISRSINDKYICEHYRYQIYKRCLNILKKDTENDLYKKAKEYFEQLKSPPIIKIKTNKVYHGISSRLTFEFNEDSDENIDIENRTTVSYVENFVLNHYKKYFNLTIGIFGEGSSFLTIYGLLFWDIMFSQLENSFFSPYQIRPWDIFSSKYYINRLELIDERMKLLKSGNSSKIQEIINKHWDENYGTTSCCVNWEIFTDTSQIFSLMDCISSDVLVGMFTLFLENISLHRSGLPDLVLWNPYTLNYKIVEVKGPNDRPSEKQIIWFHNLMRLNANIEL